MTIAINKNIARGLNTMGYWVATLFGVTLDNAYPTGGYTLAATTLKLGVIEFLTDMILQSGTTAILCKYNYSTGKLQAFWVNGATGQAAKLAIVGGQAPGIALQTDLDTNAGVLGKTTAGNIAIATTITSAAGVVLQEVDNGTDLSLFSGRGLALGKG